MPSIYDLKPRFQQLLHPLMSALVRARITPNQLTVAAMLLSLAGGICIAFSWENRQLLPLVPLVLFVRMALNALDGMMARSYGMASRLGEVLNEAGDVLSDIVLYLPLVILMSPRLDAVLAVCIFVVLGIVCEFCGVLSKALGKERRYDGPMGKSDRAFAIGCFCMIWYFFPVAAQKGAVPFFYALGILLAASCLKRLRATL